MTPEEYWNKLQSDIETFNKKNIAASDEKDNKEYEKQKNTLLKVAVIGHEANQCWTPLGKADCLKRAEALILNKDTFGEQGIPAVVGKKTRDFIESVYIPHLRARKEIDFGLQAAIINVVLKIAGSDDTLEKRIQKAQTKADALEATIKAYDAKQSALQKQSMFASPPVSESDKEVSELKELKSLSL